MCCRTRGFIILVMIVLLVLPSQALAQDEQEATASISSPNTRSFPLIEVYLEVFDSAGNFVYGLTANDIRILENSVPLPTQNLQDIQSGVQFITVLNPGRAFALRNSNGVSRYDFLVEALSNWAVRRTGSTIDIISLIENGGPQFSHLSDPGIWLESLNSINRETAREKEPNLDALSRALDLASDSTVRPGMGRVVLFITPPLESEYADSIQELVTRANENGVRINIWMVSSEGAYTPGAEEQLLALAEQTGGDFFVFTGDNQIPDPESFLEPLRNTYRIEYMSKIRESGEHQLNVEVQTSEGKLTTPPQSFEIAVQPPDPAFISPPLEIIREHPTANGNRIDDELPIQEYSPQSQEFQVLVSFPDERVRPVVRTTLYVDGEVVDERTEDPFDRLTWNLEDYTSSATHSIKVEAEDSLGLVGSSMEKLILLSIEIPEPNP